MADLVTIEHVRGDTFRFILELKQDDGTPVNLTGTTAKMTVKRGMQDTEAVLASTAFTYAFDALNGKVTITAPAAVMEIAPADYVFDVEVTYPDTSKQTPVRGILRILPDVTQ